MRIYNNKNFNAVIRIFVFIILFLFMFKYLTYLMKPPLVDVDIISGFYSEEENSLDMVYIGGSASFVYYAPLRAWEQNGISSYNYGNNTIQLDVYKYMIKEVLKTQKPKLIVLDARALEYRDTDMKPNEIYYRNTLMGMPFSKNKIEFINDVIGKFIEKEKLAENSSSAEPNLFSYYFDIIKFHSSVANSSFVKAFKMMNNKYEHPFKGFYFVPKWEIQKKENYKTENIVLPSKETESIFNDLLDYLDTIENTEFLFIVSPFIQTSNRKERLNYFENVIVERGHNFMDANDYTEEMKLDYSKDLYNESHINIFGAEKYTDFLVDYMKENYNLPDHRNEKEYSSWDDLLPAWNAKVESTKNHIEKLMEAE